MRLRSILPAFCFIWLPVSQVVAQKAPAYLGQPLPGREAVLFAPGILNNGQSTRDITLMPDGSEIYVGLFLPGFRKAVIIETHRQGKGWTAPEVAAFSRDPRWRCMEPCISPDGQGFYFVSDRPQDPKGDRPWPFGIWVMTREGRSWSEAHRLPVEVNGPGNAFYPTIRRDGTLYFLREEGQGGWLMRSSWQRGTWTAGETPPSLQRRPAPGQPPGGSGGPLHAGAHDGSARFPGRGRLLRLFQTGGWHLDGAGSSGPHGEQLCRR